MRNCTCVCALLIMSLFLAFGCKSPQTETLPPDDGIEPTAAETETSEAAIEPPMEEPAEAIAPAEQAKPEETEAESVETPAAPEATPEAQPSSEAGDDSAKASAIKAAKARDAKDFYNRGLLMEKSGNLKEAYKLYERAYELDPNYREAHEKMVKISIAMGESAPGSYDPLTDEVRLEKAKIDAMRRDVDNYIAQAQIYFDDNEFDACIEEVGRAIALMKRKEYGIDFSMQQALAEAILNTATKQKKALEDARGEESRAKTRRDINEMIENQTQYREKVEREWLDRAQIALDRRNFSEALNLCLKVLQQNPLNDEAKNLQRLINQEELIFLKEKIALEESAMWNETFRKTREAAVPEGDIMTFMSKEKWAELIQKRERRIKEIHMIVRKDDTESLIWEAINNPAQARSDLYISSKPLPELINSIMLMFGNTVPIYVTRDVYSAYSGQEFEIDINKSVTLKQVLDHLVKHTLTTDAPVSYTVRNEVVMIILKNAEEERYLRIYPIQDLLVKKQDFLPPSIDISSDIFENTDDELDEDLFDNDEEGDFDGRNDAHDPQDTDYGLEEIVKTTVGMQEWSPSKNKIQFKRGDMYILGTEEAHAIIQKLLADIRSTEDVMVNIEARFLEVSEDLAEVIGVEFTGNPDAWDIARDGRYEYTDPFLEGYLSDANKADANTDSVKSGVWFTNASDGWVTIGDETVYLADGVSNGDALGWSTEHALDGALVSALGLGTSGLTAGFDLNLGSVSMNFVFQVADRDSRYSIMQAPSITTFNRQRAYISIISQKRIVTGYSVQDAGNYDAGIVAETNPVNTGIVLDVVPTVTYDRKFVLLETKLYATASTATNPRQFTLVRAERVWFGGVAAPIMFNTSLSIPKFTTQNIRTTVLIPDNGTVLLGGRSDYRDRQGNSGVPVLSKIPVLGFFFSKKGHSTYQRVLLIFLHAKICVASYEEQKHMER